MIVTYFALVSFDDYTPGDIIPGAGSWPYIQHYVSEGRVAPVLVATLPQEMQDKLKAWAEEHDPVVLAAKAQAKKDAEAAAAAEAKAAEAAAAEQAAAVEAAQTLATEEAPAPVKKAAAKSTASKQK